MTSGETAAANESEDASASPSDTPELGVRKGDVIAGKYRVDRILRTGGMGAVVAAHHEPLDEPVALKFLLPHALANPEAVERFAAEARAAVKIKSDHVARVTDVGQLDNGAPYMVMELLQGVDLADWLEQRGPMPVEQAVDFVLQACEAIAEAHALGIVHRDLKPANLFCVARPDGSLSIKVLDFGISKLPSSEDRLHVTRPWAVVGSPAYMSPEQLQSSADVDARTDIWSIGVILFELLAGSTPFQAESMPDLLAQIATAPAPMLSRFRLDVPPRLERAIATCLEKDRAHRFASVAELAIALHDFGSVHGAPGCVTRIVGTLAPRESSAITLVPLNASPAARTRSSDSLQATATWGRTAVRTGSRSNLRPVFGVALAVLGAALLGGALVARNAGPAALSAGLTESMPPVVASCPRPFPPAPEAVAVLPPLEAPALAREAPAVPSARLAAPGPAPVVHRELAPGPVMLPHRSPAYAVPSKPAAAVETPASTPPVSPIAAPPPPTPRYAPAGAAGTTCDPPYVIDEQGRKHFKRQCFLRH